MQQRWLSLVYNQNPRYLCCRLLYSLLILTLFTAPLYVPLTEINLVTVAPFCTLQTRVLCRWEAKHGMLERMVESEFLLQMMLTSLFNLEFLKVFVGLSWAYWKSCSLVFGSPSCSKYYSVFIFQYNKTVHVTRQWETLRLSFACVINYNHLLSHFLEFRTMFSNKLFY